jgi:hypothetical protein
MKTLKKLLNVSLSSVQLEKLYEVIDVDGDGLISTAGTPPRPPHMCARGLRWVHSSHASRRVEFLDAFQVVDVAQENRKAARTRSEPA